MVENSRTVEGFAKFSENELFVLKFPSKLWRIVNECSTGAIRWGLFGSTVLIDYNQFQAEYLECTIPKFKTKNITSFVRQLNMYGFKKVQTQQKNVMARFFSIHEFYNDSFRLGRPDLLHKVKRQAIPMKEAREGTRNYDRKSSRLELCRNTFEKTLLQSVEFRHFWKLDSLHLSGDAAEAMHAPAPGEKVGQPKYKIRIIPADNAHVSNCENFLTTELFSDYEGLLNENETVILAEADESERDDTDEDEVDTSAFDVNFATTSENEYFFFNKRGEPYHIQVKNDFDGNNYIIDVVGRDNLNEGSPDGEESEKHTDGISQLTGITYSEELQEGEKKAPTIHSPETDDFFSCLNSAIASLTKLN